MFASNLSMPKHSYSSHDSLLSGQDSLLSGQDNLLSGLDNNFFITQFDELITFKSGLGKHGGEKETMLITSIFSFTHNVFYPIKDILHNLGQISLSSAHALGFGPV